MNYNEYHATDPIDPRFEAVAFLEADELIFDIRVQLESGERSTNLRWQEQLRKILAYFAKRFKTLRVCWSYGENLTAFNRAIAAGAEPEWAARRTFIGHELYLAGYSDVSIRSQEGLRARYTKVVVSFRKP
ncbi:MAG: hypothetical protein C5B58_10670 [Acidobacteria bacterium]|nr:MAG: hypothetical protein C5B58_10670 [Acidobacteriota bacterium]